MDGGWMDACTYRWTDGVEWVGYEMEWMGGWMDTCIDAWMD